MGIIKKVVFSEQVKNRVNCNVLLSQFCRICRFLALPLENAIGRFLVRFPNKLIKAQAPAFIRAVIVGTEVDAILAGVRFRLYRLNGGLVLDNPLNADGLVKVWGNTEVFADAFDLLRRQGEQILL